MCIEISSLVSAKRFYITSEKVGIYLYVCLHRCLPIHVAWLKWFIVIVFFSSFVRNFPLLSTLIASTACPKSLSILQHENDMVYT